MRPKADRAFHLQENPRDKPEPRSMYAAGWKPFWEEYDSELFVDLVTSLRSRRDMRERVITHMRHAWWNVRNQGKRAPKMVSGRESIIYILESYELLWWAGYEEFDLQQLTNCLSHKCTCDGCDLFGGERFADAPEDWIGNPVTALGNGGGQRPMQAIAGLPEVPPGRGN